MIVITEAINTITPVYTEYPYYAFSINIGDIPSSVESFTSTNNVITAVTYTAFSAFSGGYKCSVNSANVFSGSDYYIILTYRSIRTPSVGGDDNEVFPAITYEYDKVSFGILLQEATGSTSQNIAIDGIMVRRA